MSAVRRDFSVLVIRSGLGILFGFEPILSPVSIDESDDPPVIIAVRFSLNSELRKKLGEGEASTSLRAESIR